jgi:drug/metabolite transporter (DMT)-like permease
MQQHSSSRLPLAGFVITFVGAILFSTKAIAVKLAFKHTPMDGLTLLTLRMIFALPFYIVAALLAARSKKDSPLTKRQWMYIITLGLAGYYLSSLFDFTGLQYISAGLERLILFLYPSFAVIMNAAFFKQRVTRMQKWALVLTYLGISIAYWGELHIDVHNPNFIWGSVLIILCAVTFAFYIIGSGRLIPQVGAGRFTAYAMIAACAGVFAHFILMGKAGNIDFSHNYWGYGLYLGIVATVLPTFMISGGMKRIGSNNVAIISAIGPVSTIIQAHFILGEPLFAEQLLGTALVITGVLITGWKSAGKLSFK